MKRGRSELLEISQAPDLMRLNRYLAQCGLGSRREVEKLITRGEVRINGETVRNLATQVDSRRDEVVVGGERVRAMTVPMHIMLNKPAGYITTAQDEAGRKTVFELVKHPVRIFPVGRLDRDSEGLLLLTNDGELAYRLTQARFNVPKVYQVWLDKGLRLAVVSQFRDGILIDETHRVRGELRFPKSNESRFCEVTIGEGRNRQVRKMFAALGYRVKALQRTQIGPLLLGKLKLGAWRYLTDKEIKLLKQAVSLQNEEVVEHKF
jgi:23S rRNA pseudouridine2605 synthase